MLPTFSVDVEARPRTGSEAELDCAIFREANGYFSPLTSLPL